MEILAKQIAEQAKRTKLGGQKQNSNVIAGATLQNANPANTVTGGPPTRRCQKPSIKLAHRNLRLSLATQLDPGTLHKENGPENLLDCPHVLAGLDPKGPRAPEYRIRGQKAWGAARERRNCMLFATLKSQECVAKNSAREHRNRMLFATLKSQECVAKNRARFERLNEAQTGEKAWCDSVVRSGSVPVKQTPKSEARRSKQTNIKTEDMLRSVGALGVHARLSPFRFDSGCQFSSPYRVPPDEQRSPCESHSFLRPPVPPLLAVQWVTIHQILVVMCFAGVFLRHVNAPRRATHIVAREEQPKSNTAGFRLQTSGCEV
ncbi:hypothetical protein R1sor_002359 [Riccia sorocarpa]|uniref:Uncharacterized protein n=1 Tax=Riccia sorocarpa TaxID=122646 RepID=A0ABD3H1R4_9MARC